MKRTRQVRGITITHRPRRHSWGGFMPSICLDCFRPVDRSLAVAAYDAGFTYRCACGRRLA